jgi:hypothetical protein
VRRTIGAALLALAACASIAGLGACRAVLGIEQLELTDASPADGSQPPKDGSTAADAGFDAPSPPGDGAPACPQPQGPACYDCCRMTSMPGTQAVTMFAGMMQSAGTSCLCGPMGQCQSACASTACSGQMVMPSAACNDCLDQALFPPDGAPPAVPCQTAIEGCEDSGACSQVLSCMRACVP